jgi:hypothetical protein
MLEYPVPEETGPYLVSSSSSVMWITELHPNATVKAAIREVPLGVFFQEVIEAVTVMGRQQNWGNVHPLTLEGLQAAIQHVASYDLEPLELLIPRSRPPGGEPFPPEDEEEGVEAPKASRVPLMPPELRPLIEEVGLTFRPSAWVPDGTVIVVPKDRAFVGLVHQVTSKKIAGVVHNAARGIGIAQSSGAQSELPGRSSSEVFSNDLVGRPLSDPDAG